jgi:hypothetical protein
VHVFSYFDVGIGGRKPTWATMLGDIDKKPYDVSENPFGAFLPHAWYTQVLMPGTVGASGRIELQMPAQDAYNQVQRFIFAMLRRGAAMDIYDPAAFDPNDLARLNDPNNNIPVTMLASLQGEDVQKAWQRVPMHQLGAWCMDLLELFNLQKDRDSGTNRMERGEPMPGKTTATGVVAYQRQAQTPGTWNMRQAVKFHVRIVQRSLRVAAQFDRAPLLITLKGIPVPINLPHNPSSSIRPWLMQYSPCTIAEQDLAYQDEEMESQREIAKLMSLAPYVGKGYDPVWWLTLLAEACGFDPKQALQQMAPPQQAAPGMQPGPQGQGPQALGAPGTGQGAPGVVPTAGVAA